MCPPGLALGCLHPLPQVLHWAEGFAIYSVQGTSTAVFFITGMFLEVICITRWTSLLQLMQLLARWPQTVPVWGTFSAKNGSALYWYVFFSKTTTHFKVDQNIGLTVNIPPQKWEDTLPSSILGQLAATDNTLHLLPWRKL